MDNITYAQGFVTDREETVDELLNEAVELAKTYSSDEAPAFINGILGQILGSEANA